MKVVIVGGVAGGATAAARLRRLDESAEIVILERSNFISYANCGLPYYIGGAIASSRELTLQTPESFRRRFRIDVRVGNEAVNIDRNRKTVTVKNLATGEIYEEGYDKLLLSPGAKPNKPEIPGIDSEKIFTLRTVEDTLKIKAFTERSKPESAVVIGGGYIGVEMAENLAGAGVRVVIVQRSKQLLSPFDYDMACQLHGLMRRKGVQLEFGCDVKGFNEDGEKILTKLEDGRAFDSDMVILAIGISPDTELAKKAALEMGAKRSISVNERMETSDSDIYAVGDAVEIEHMITEERSLISLAGPANKQGRIAADNICGGNSVYRGASGSSVIKLFDMTAATTGINERTAKKKDLDYEKIVLTPLSHAAYYPEARTMTIKLLYEKDTMRILGAQIFGHDGVDKRIDVIATAMQAGMRADGLKELDLAYAPPYSSAKDPVNMAGYMAENIETGKVRQFHWEDVERLPRDGSVVLLDVRTAFEYNAGHVKDFVNIPVDELRERMCEIDEGKPVYVICHSGLRSYIACRILAQKGYECYNFSGGYGFLESVMKESSLY